MGVIADIARKIKGNSCQRLVKYTANELTISGIAAGTGNFIVDIGKISNKIVIINTIPEVMKAYDNNQFLLCCQANSLPKGSLLRDECLRIRLLYILSFGQLQALLSVPNHSEEKIKEWLQNMGNLTDECIAILKPHSRDKSKKVATSCADTQAFPNSDRKLPKALESEEHVAKIKKVMAYQGVDEKDMKEALILLRK